MKERFPYARPVIGITCHVARQTSPGGHQMDFHRLAARYAFAIQAAGGVPVVLPASGRYAAEPAAAVTAVDGLLISGGTDLPPESFGKETHPSLRGTDPERYDYECALIREAWQRRMPMAGICRGHQTMAEALGGRLTLNIGLEVPGGLVHYQQAEAERTSHEIEIYEHTMLRGWLGPRSAVNSFHRQAVDALPDGFGAAARAKDGVIEAMESAEPFALGLQFHPEWLVERHGGFLEIFRALVSSAGQLKSIKP